VSAAASSPQPVIFERAADFRAWLEANHASARELWVGYYKKGAGKTSMTYAEAVEEALCFGWIDGLTKSFGEFYANRFTPRRKGSNWSAINIARMAGLERAGRLHPAGRDAFEQRDRRRDAVYSYENPARQLLPEMERRLRANDAAWRYWQSETPSYRRGAAAWVLDAKRETTREKRLAELISDSAASLRIKPYRYFESARGARSKR
jgi:uncharacterized protein YdeI (YjbR/CyaY-like superfamily)